MKPFQLSIVKSSILRVTQAFLGMLSGLIIIPNLTFADVGDEGFNLNKAVVVTAEAMMPVEQKAIEMLLEEVEKRTLIAWEVLHEWPDASIPVIAVGSIHSLPEFAPLYEDELLDSHTDKQAEGYRLTVDHELRAAPTVFVIGNDARGVLYGCGRLLREMGMEQGQAILASELEINTSPETVLRGHQLGYRPKTNSYDAWTEAMWEQYIRDLAVFGTNAIELIPPRSDDADQSPHFPRPKIDMMRRMSQICDDYGMDVWIWYPALNADYSKPESVELALREWGNVFKQLPRIDAVFVPGGDPGHTRPKHLMNLLEKQTGVLRQYHPQAEMWFSPQSFTSEWMDEILTLLNEEPEWLSGVVFGPQNRISLPELRHAVPQRYPIRRYPDITHSLQSQYPVPDWDVGYAITEHREVINPRPIQYAHIYRQWQDEAIGFITYSEGSNDDVNKILWSALGWDSKMDVYEILRQYSRYFIGEAYADDFSQGVLALEQNWRGPLLTNTGVESTLKIFQEMEAKASPKILLKWRFQQSLYRAYYDAYQRRRLLYETELESRAMDILRQAKERGTLVAMRQAETVLDKAVTKRAGPDLRQRIFELAEALYQSNRMQLSVPKYDAIHFRRGANLDLVDNPLNERKWLKEQFAEIRTKSDETARLKALGKIVNWNNPGPGGFYDNLGNAGRQPHLIRGPAWEEDPEYRRRARLGISKRFDWKFSYISYAESRYDAPLKMHYKPLDPSAQYRVRVVYSGDTDNLKAKIRLRTDEDLLVHDYLQKPDPVAPVEFEVPQQATEDGELMLIFNQTPGLGGNGRGCQVAEVWLIKEESNQRK